MNSDFKITSEQIQQPNRNSVTVFNLRGWLDAFSEENLIIAAQEAHTNGTHHLILNLEDVSMLTSRGIRALQKVQKLFIQQDASKESSGIRLCNAQPNVYHVLKVSGFLQILPVYETLQAALDSYETK